MKVSILILVFAIIISIVIISQYNPTRSEINSPDTASPPGWYQQNLDVNIGSTGISDLLFIDTLLGFATTSNGSPNDTGYIIKTTSGGDNWNLVYKDMKDFSKVFFLSKDTGYVCGGYGTGAVLLKTTNQGVNWFNLNIPGGGLINFYDMSVLNKDTIWVTETNPLVGGIFRTTNGGVSWQKMDNGITGNLPTKLYFYNSNIGFASFSPQSNLYKTTNGGVNWFIISPNDGLIDLYFFDSLTGYKSNGNIRKTTNGGYNWVTQSLPQSGNISNSFNRMSVVNQDTIWGVGGTTINTGKGIIYKTTNGGINWGYQTPITNPISYRFYFIKFIDPLHGWAYNNYSVDGGGVRTIKGGDDSTIYTSVVSQGNDVPTYFELKQNYPNPFNSNTKIEFNLHYTANVSLYIYDITGREIIKTNGKIYQPGNQNILFNADDYKLSSGLYFYKLDVTNQKGNTTSKTKVMVYLK